MKSDKKQPTEQATSELGKKDLKSVNGGASLCTETMRLTGMMGDLKDAIQPMQTGTVMTNDTPMADSSAATMK